MATTPPRRREAERTPSDEEREAAIEEFVPETPREEAKEIARGEAPRTPFVLVASMYVAILSFAAIVTGIVVLAIWLA